MRCVYGFLSRYLPGLARCGLVLAGLSWAVGASAQAQPDPWVSVPHAVEQGAGWRLTYKKVGQPVSSLGRTSMAANDGIAISEQVGLRTPAGQAAVKLTRSVAGSALRGALVDTAIAIGRGGLAGGAAVAAAALLSPLADKFMQDMGYSKDESGAWTVPSKLPPVMVPGGYWWSGARYSKDLYELATLVYGASLSIGGRCNGYTGDYSAPFGGMEACLYVWPNNVGAGVVAYATQFHATYQTGPVPSCPGGGSVDSQGQCTGPAQLIDASAAKTAAENSPDKMPDVQWAPYVDAMEALEVAPPPPVETVISGDTVVVGNPSVSTETVTDVQGTSSTVTVTETPTSYLDYYGEQVTVRTEVSKTVTNPDGSTKTTTNTVGSNTTDSPCFGLGSILGCTELGTPEAASVPTTTKQITYSAEDVSLPSGCPAPVSMGRFGSLSFQPACDSAGYMRPLILAGAAISALLICVYAVVGAKT